MLVDWVIMPLEKEVPIVLEGYGGFKFSKHQVPSLWMSVWWWVRLVLWWHSCDLLKYLSNSREQFKGWLPLLSLCRQRFAILMLVTFRWVFAANNYVSQHLRLGHTIGGTARYVKLRIAILNLPPIIVCCRQLSLTNPLADGRKSQSRPSANSQHVENFATATKLSWFLSDFVGERNPHFLDADGRNYQLLDVSMPC